VEPGIRHYPRSVAIGQILSKPRRRWQSLMSVGEGGSGAPGRRIVVHPNAGTGMGPVNRWLIPAVERLRRCTSLRRSTTLLRPFAQVDVFGAAPYLGNPVAVVLDGGGLSTDEMRRFARWTNLSETTFVLPPTISEADYGVRIFTPSTELPFAGHPTLGTCHAWLTTSDVDHDPDFVIQECGAGLVELRRTAEGLAFAAPPLVRSGPVDETLTRRIAEVLRIERSQILDTQWVDNGPGWVAALLRSAAEVLALRPGNVDFDLGVVGPHPQGSPEAFEVRAFVPSDGVTVEDPVTGSLNASLAEWLLRTGRAEVPYTVSQGTVVGRSGRVHITRDDKGTIWTGGNTMTHLSGQVDL
jgi:PhzF family phenazine biosynthesis protein